MLGQDYKGQDCSLARALEVLGERWTLLIVRDAFYGVQRFSDFQAHLDIPRGVLSDRLSGLVDDGVLRRRPDPSHTGRYLYELSPAGCELWPALNALANWGARHRRPGNFTYRHAACGTALDERGYCTHCELAPPPDDIFTERRRGGSSTRTDPVSVALREPHRLLEPIVTR